MHVSTNDHLHTHMTHKYLLENKYVLNFMLSCKSYSRYFDALPLDFHPMILLPNLDDIQVCEIKQQNTKIPAVIKLTKKSKFLHMLKVFTLF